MNRFKLTIPAQEIGEALNIGDSIIYQGNGEVETVVTKSNHDGSETKTAIITPILTEVRRSDIHYQAPAVFKGEVKHTSDSEKQRNKYYVLWQKLGSQGNFQDYYHKRMEDNLDEIDQEIADTDMEGLL